MTRPEACGPPRREAIRRIPGGSVSKRVEALATVALAQADAENRYRRRKARGEPAVGVQMLDELDGRAK